MERLLLYLVVAAAVFTVLSAARLKPQQDYCSEARRFASAVLTVNQSKGWIVDTYLLDGVVVNATGIYHPGCGIIMKLPVANATTLSGSRLRLMILYADSILVIRRLGSRI